MDSIEQILGIVLVIISFCSLWYTVLNARKLHPVYRTLLVAMCAYGVTFALFGEWWVALLCAAGLAICCAGILAELRPRELTVTKKTRHDNPSEGRYQFWMGSGALFSLALSLIWLIQSWGSGVYLISIAIAATTVLSSAVLVCGSRNYADSFIGVGGDFQVNQYGNLSATHPRTTVVALDLGRSLVLFLAGGIYALLALLGEAGFRLIFQKLPSWEAAIGGIIAVVLLATLAGLIAIINFKSTRAHG